MNPTPLNVLWPAAADVVADTVGTAVAIPVADIAGAAADIAADAQAALAGAAADTAVITADARAALADAAADAVAAADSVSDIYRRACRVHRSPAHPAASGFKTSGQGMTAVGPVRAPVELFRADEATLQFTQTAICSQSKVSFLGSILRGKTIQDSTANLLFVYLDIVIMYVEG